MLTPADIKNRTIKTTMGGYNKKDTDEFIASILESFEELNNENKKIKEKLSSLSDGIQYYKNMEDNLQKALVLAEKTSDETKNAAKAEAANIVSLAKKEADEILSNAKNEADEMLRNTKSDIDKDVLEAQNKANILNEKLSRLTTSFENYKRDIKAIVEDQLEFIESEDYSPETPVFDIPIEKFKWTSIQNDENTAESEAVFAVENSDENIDDAEVVTSFSADESGDEEVDDLLVESDETADNDDNTDENETTIDDESLKNELEKDETTDDETSEDETPEDTDNTINTANEDDDISKTPNTPEDDIVVENIMATPTLEGVDSADISNTVFPASKPDKESVSYLSKNQDINKKTAENANPFTFIDLD